MPSQIDDHDEKFTDSSLGRNTVGLLYDADHEFCIHEYGATDGVQRR